MGTELTPTSKAEQALAAAKTPQESKAVEAMAAAAREWSREVGDFETLIRAVRILFLARRKTTELSKYLAPVWGREAGHPFGGNRYQTAPKQGDSSKGNIVVTFTSPDFGFSKEQWHRRLKELEEVNEDDIDEYLAECTSKYMANESPWEPSISGLMRFVSEPKPKQAEREDRWKDVQAWTAGIRAWLSLVDMLPASRKKHYTEVVAEQKELAELAKKAGAIIRRTDEEGK